jgi:hypothetical protein
MFPLRYQLTGASLARAGVTDLVDLKLAVPTLNLTNGFLCNWNFSGTIGNAHVKCEKIWKLPTTWTLPQNEMALARLLAASLESWDQQRRPDHGTSLALEMRASESVRYGGENDRMQKHPSGG